MRCSPTCSSSATTRCRGTARPARLRRECGVDCVVGVGPLAKYIVEGFGPSGVWFASNAEAAAYLKTQVRPGDAVLCKGSRSMHTDEIIRALAAG